MSTLPIVRGVVFFSKTASMTLAGQSGKRYHFKNSEETSPVLNAIDIKFFRDHPQLREKGQPKMTAAEMAAKKRPKSYTEAGKRTKTFPPPSQDQLHRANRRRDIYNETKKKEAEEVSAKGLAKAGVGTTDAQEMRKINARISAGELSATVAPVQAKPAPKNLKVEVKPAVLKQVDPEPPSTPVAEPVAVAPANAAVSKAQCPFCGRKLHNEKGMNIHVNRWCKKNPESPEYDPDV